MNFDSYIGQREIVEDLKIHINHSMLSLEPLEHTILYGSAGLGKTTLAECIAKELYSKVWQKTGQEINLKTLYSLFNDIDENDILFIDEIHNTPVKTMEILYGPLQIINNMKINQDVKYFNFEGQNINPFTLIGGTTSAGMLAKPLRDRMILMYNLKFYTEEELTKILMNYKCPKESACAISQKARGVPRIALNYFIRIRNEVIYAQHITKKQCETNFKRWHVFFDGSTINDWLVIKHLYLNKTTSITNLCKANRIDQIDYHNMYEPFLLQKGLISIDSKGRSLTEIGNKYYEDYIKEKL